jgi:hypothetical protein
MKSDETKSIGGVWLCFSKIGDACKADAEAGLATKEELSRTVLLGCGEGWGRASVALTPNEARALARELIRLSHLSYKKGMKGEGK